MILRDQFPGKETLFGGDRILELRSIPKGAKIVKAIIRVTPVNNEGNFLPSEDTITFTDDVGRIVGQQNKFATRTTVLNDPTNEWVEIDFHGSRTLLSVAGESLSEASLQVDVGSGTFVEINSNGAFKGPDDDNDFMILGPDLSPELVPLQHPLPGLFVKRFKLTRVLPTPAPRPIAISSVIIRNVASNVSLGLGTIPPFWIHLGDMIETQISTDFAEFLQAFLADAKVQNGFFTIPIVVHSDSLARLNIDLEIEYTQQQSALREELNEVFLPYSYDSSPKSETDLINISIPANARVIPGETNARVVGSFDDTRVVHEILAKKELDKKESDKKKPNAVEISPEISQAYLVEHDNVLSVSAIDLFLEPIDETVKLQLDLRHNLDGKPDKASLLSIPIDFSLDRKKTDKPDWVNVALPQGFRFEQVDTKNRYWIVIQSKAGIANWRVNIATGSEKNMLRSLDGGLSWRETKIKDTSVDALFRLRNVPERFKMPIKLQIGTGDKAQILPLDRFNPTGRVDFSLDFAEVAETINAFLDATEEDHCREIEHLINGDFQNKEFDDVQNQILQNNQFIRPKNWALTMGSVNYPHLQSNGERFPLIVLGGEVGMVNQATGLSQITDVSGECSYQFEFFGAELIDDPATIEPGAEVEIIWLNADCSPNRIDKFEFPVLNVALDSTTPTNILFDVLRVFLRTYGTTGGINSIPLQPGFPVRRVEIQPPVEAVGAEIRFLVPADNLALVDKVSLKTSQEKIVHGDLLEIGQDQDQEASFKGWRIEPAEVITQELISENAVEKFNTGFPPLEPDTQFVSIATPEGRLEPVALIQTVAVLENHPYTFQFIGRTPRSEEEIFPEIRLRWSTIDGTSLDPEIVELITPTDPNLHSINGTTPENAEQLEIRLVLPPRSVLLVGNLSFQQVEMIDIPLDFIAEAPGELTVSDFQVAYETIKPQSHITSKTEKCNATPANKDPGKSCKICKE